MNPEVLSSSEHPRTWEELTLPNGTKHRIIYAVHDPLHPNRPEELGEAGALGFELAVDGLLDEKRMQALMNYVSTEGTTQYGPVMQYAAEKGMPVFNIDTYMPNDAFLNRIMQLEAEEYSRSNMVNALLALVAVGGMQMPHSKQHPTRRAVINTFLGGTALTALSPIINHLLMKEMLPPDISMETLPSEGIVIDEDSLVRQAQHVFADISETELRTLFGHVDFVLAFRNFLMAEKMSRAAAIAKERGIKMTANICGAAHTGMEMALRMSSETRMRVIMQTLLKFMEQGADPQEVEQIRQSIDILPEAWWNQEVDAWETRIHTPE